MGILEAVQDFFTSLNINFCLIFELRDFSILNEVKNDCTPSTITIAKAKLF
jgi:hypothetical protein